MAMSWGVDSARTPNSNALDGTVCFDSVTQRAGAAPAFWGRYIGGFYAMTAAEATYLHGKGCSVLLVYNGTSNSAGSVQGGFAEGQADGNAAADAATALAVPPGIAIFADVEGSWTPTSDWLRGWATAVTARNFIPGMYANCTPGSNFAQAYCVAQAAEPAVAGSLLWSMEPEPAAAACQAGANAPPFAPATPGCAANVVLWQYTEGCWEDTLGNNAGIDMDVAMDTALTVMW
jgi:hypothetical protein